MHESSFYYDNSNQYLAHEKYQSNKANKLENSKVNKQIFNNKDFENSGNFSKKENYSDKNANLIAKVNSKLNKDKEFKYKKLNQEMQDFCKLLDDYTRENLIYKLNEKLRTNLNPATVYEIKELESKINILQT